MPKRCRVSRRKLLVATGSAATLAGCMDQLSGDSGGGEAGEGGYGSEAYGNPT